MALPILAPAITKTRQAIADTSARTILRLVPELESGKQLSTKSLSILTSIIMGLLMLAMFTLTSLSTQDAFTLAKLQREAQILSDQKDAINREVAFRSSPNALANAARKLGMEPNSQPRFIDISDVANG